MAVAVMAWQHKEDPKQPLAAHRAAAHRAAAHAMDAQAAAASFQMLLTGMPALRGSSEAAVA